jgi:hypothetical protein
VKARRPGPLRKGMGERAAAGEGINCHAGYTAESRGQLFPAAGSAAESAFDVGEVRQPGCSLDLEMCAVSESRRRRPAKAAYAGGKPRRQWPAISATYRVTVVPSRLFVHW